VHLDQREETHESNIPALAGVTASAVCACLIELNIETPPLDRFRNELASRLSGVASPKANTEGLRLLRLLNACAPSESDATFLPQQRTVFMLQGLQKWVAEDAELGAQLELELITIIIHTVPLVQSVPGAHWDFISSLIEMNLEARRRTPLTYPASRTYRNHPSMFLRQSPFFIEH